MQLELLTPDMSAERAMRDRGMNMAADCAERSLSGWNEAAMAFFIDFVAMNAGSFMTEEVRKLAEREGLPKPPDSRAWGSVVTRAVKLRLIKRIGYGPQSAAGCHMAPKSIWKRA